MDYTEVVCEAMDFMHNKYDENILVSNISKQIYLSLSYFTYVFRTITGFTVKDYLNRYRLYRAANEQNYSTKPRMSHFCYYHQHKYMLE